MKILIFTVFLLVSNSVFASAFCNGFEEGFRSIKGNMVMLPMCPMQPMTPMGSTPFREGIKVGMATAYRGY